MKISDDEFNQLKSYWYAHLRNSGFIDIEKEGRPLKKSFAVYSDSHETQRIAKEEYYALITHAVENEYTYFRNETDKYIMQKHAEGYTIAAIVKSLFHIGKKKSKRAIGVIIRRYEMAWMIRSYTREELNLYD